MNTPSMDDVYLRDDRPAAGLLGLAERGWIPDALLRRGMRRYCERRLLAESAGGPVAMAARRQARVDALRRGEMAAHVGAVHAWHDDLPPRFFELCLGPRLKYSAAYYPSGFETLAQGEEAMLELCGARAELDDGQSILELGCGWGAFTLWMAERHPRATITALCHSHAQRRYIQARCAARGFDNVTVIVDDISRLDLPLASFDRCLSIETFAHMQNYRALMSRIALWLRPGGKLFVHTIAHRTHAYAFETDGEEHALSRHFFTGGLVPSVDTLLWFQESLHAERHWLVDGRHHARTANQWLANQDAARAEIMAVLRETYGEAAGLWFRRWRLFWMACAEQFGYNRGGEWMVAHYRFVRPEPWEGSLTGPV